MSLSEVPSATSSATLGSAAMEYPPPVDPMLEEGSRRSRYIAAAALGVSVAVGVIGAVLIISSAVMKHDDPAMSGEKAAATSAAATGTVVAPAPAPTTDIDFPADPEPATAAATPTATSTASEGTPAVTNAPTAAATPAPTITTATIPAASTPSEGAAHSDPQRPPAVVHKPPPAPPAPTVKPKPTATTTSPVKPPDRGF